MTGEALGEEVSVEELDASSVKFAAANKSFRRQFGEIHDANSDRNSADP